MSHNYTVPWICKRELLDVYDKLYSERVCDRLDALQHITGWKARCNSRLPVSIVCSADLVDAQLACRLYSRRESAALSENTVRQSLALALVRFVNFITDRYQRGGSNVAIPIHRIGAEIGIPGWIVTLRHEVTHRALPTLPVLTRGAQWAVQWLKENFWEQQVDKGHPSMESNRSMTSDDDRDYSSTTRGNEGGQPNRMTITDKRISCLFVAYQQIRFQELAGKSFRERDIGTGDECRQVIDEIKKLLFKDKDKVMSVLVQTGYLLPTDAQLAQLGLAPELHKDEKIKGVLAVFWWPFLQEMNNQRMIPSLVQRLALFMTESECPRRRYILIWLQLVLGREITFPGGGNAQLFSNTISLLDLPWLQECLQNPNSNTQDLLQSLSGSLTKEAANKLITLVDIYMGQGTSDRPCGGIVSESDSPIHCLEELPSDDNDNMSSGSSWNQAKKKIDWLHLPVGILPGQDPQSLFNSLTHYCESVHLQAEDSNEDGGVCKDVNESCAPSTFCWDCKHLDKIQGQLTIYN